jgi:hypothetical protein
LQWDGELGLHPMGAPRHAEPRPLHAARPLGAGGEPIRLHRELSGDLR